MSIIDEKQLLAFGNSDEAPLRSLKVEHWDEKPTGTQKYDIFQEQNDSLHELVRNVICVWHGGT